MHVRRPLGAGCAWHTADAHPLPYLLWHARAERSRRRGERQARCPCCGRFFFPWEARGPVRLRLLEEAGG